MVTVQLTSHDIPRSFKHSPESVIISAEVPLNCDNETTGVHFLSEEETQNLLTPKLEEPDTYEIPECPIRTKSELLEYVIRDDGSVICKLCGDVSPSRTHWYRHKYKVHIINPAPIFKCHNCNVFFKSRRGYIGHLQSRHSAEGIDTDNIEEYPEDSRKEGNKVVDYEEQREKEEKLVTDIINRVKKECEQQGTTVSRKGYNRRQTVMNS